MTASATSSARPNRPSGMSRSRRRPSSLSTRSVVISVTVTPGRHGVDADPARPELAGERPGQPDQPGLRRAVGGRLGDADLAQPRGDVDDRAAAPLDHRRQDGPTGVEGGRQVGPDDRVPVGRVDLEERPDQRQPGVVDQAVDAPEALDDPLDQRLGLPAVGDVGREALGLGARVARPLQRALRTLRRAVVVDRHRRPLGGRLDGHLGADAAAAAGDEHDPAGQRARHQNGNDGGSSRTVTHCHSVNVSKLASPPNRLPLPEAPIPPNGMMASSFSVPSLTWTMPALIRLREGQPARDRARVDGGDEAVLAGVREGERLLVGVEGRDRGDRPEDLVGPGGQVGRHVGQDRRAVEQALVRAALGEPGPAGDRSLDDAVDAGELLLVDDRPELRRPRDTDRRAGGASPSSASAST